MSERAVFIQARYQELNAQNGHTPWTTAEYLQGFVGDVGALAKLVMARNNFREIADADRKLGHELADCLWSIMVIANELGIDLEREFVATMDTLETRITDRLA